MAIRPAFGHADLASASTRWPSASSFAAMNVLAFDTCVGAVSVSVRWQDDAGTWQQHDAYEEMATGQAERLMPTIAEVMQASGQTFAGIDRIAATCGPGSFTGVRVGVAAARALALAIDK